MTRSLLGILIVSALAAGGIFMEPLPLDLILEVLGLVVLYLLALDFLKVRIVRAFQVQPRSAEHCKRTIDAGRLVDFAPAGCPDGIP